VAGHPLIAPHNTNNIIGRDRRMTKLGIICLCALSAMPVVASAEGLIEAGQWTVTQSMVMNGNVIPPQAKARCITPEQAEDVTKTFGPVAGTINSTCEAPSSEMNGKTFKWRLQCRGQLDVDVAGDFNFDTPQHYTATITSKGRMAGALISDVKTEVVGERVGDCPN
jgi:uncharacterized protein DUF3617